MSVSSNFFVILSVPSCTSYLVFVSDTQGTTKITNKSTNQEKSAIVCSETIILRRLEKCSQGHVSLVPPLFKIL